MNPFKQFVLNNFEIIKDIDNKKKILPFELYDLFRRNFNCFICNIENPNKEKIWFKVKPFNPESITYKLFEKGICVKIPLNHVFVIEDKLFMDDLFNKEFKVIDCRKGFERGHPDFILENNKGKLIYIELKKGNDRLQKTQTNWIDNNQNKEIWVLHIFDGSFWNGLHAIHNCNRKIDDVDSMIDAIYTTLSYNQ